MTTKGEQRIGLLNGIAAYALWGLVPMFWPLVDSAAAVEILAHRMVWSLVVVAVPLLVMRRWAWAVPLLRQPRKLALITIAAATISVNWGVYIWAVNSGHVVEASLGYFINPLVSIAMGVLLLKERLRPAQWVAVGTGFAAVITLTFGYGSLPWISLHLAISFGTYGLIKKKIGLGGLESLAAETTIQFLPALGYVLWLGTRGQGTFTEEGAGHAALLASAGLVTAIPLVCFGASAIRVPLSTLGLLQYLAPILQFLLGVLYFREAMPPERWAGFVLVWLALAVLTWDALRTARHNRAKAVRLRSEQVPADRTGVTETPDGTPAPLHNTQAPSHGTQAPSHGTQAPSHDKEAPRHDTEAPQPPVQDKAPDPVPDKAPVRDKAPVPDEAPAPAHDQSPIRKPGQAASGCASATP